MHMEDCSAMRISVLIATRQRPVELRRCLDSLGRTKFRQLRGDDVKVDVVVVDNAAAPTGYRPDELSSRCGWPVRVFTQARTGIPFARNTAITNRHPEANVVIFLDDDMTVTPSWLEQMLIAFQTYEADFISGPSLPRLPPAISNRARVALGGLTNPRHPAGTILSWASTANLLITSDWLARQDPWLDESFGTSGGSDVEWTQRSIAEGATIVHVDRGSPGTGSAKRAPPCGGSPCAATASGSARQSGPEPVACRAA